MLQFLFPRGSFFSVAVQLTIIAAIPFIYYEYPVTYAILTAEDNWGEFATFVAFIVASLLFAALFTFSKTRRRDWWLLALAIGTFLAAMEEMSWGQRLFGVPTPDFIQNYNRQAETNFHNLWDSALQSTYVVVSLGFVTYGVLLPIICAVYPPLDRLVKRLNLPLPTLSLAPLFVAPAYFWMFSGLTRNNEIFELFMGFALAAFAVEQVIPQFRLLNRSNYSRWLEVVAIPVCLLASFVTAMVLTGFVNTSEQYFHQNLNYMATLKLPDAGHYEQAEAIFSYLERNPQAAQEDLLINKAQLFQTLDRREEALEVLKQARDLEFTRRLTSPDDYNVLSRLAKIHLLLGSEFISRKYRHEALAALDRKIDNLDSEREKYKARSSRPAWTYRIWPLEGVSEGTSRLLVERGNVYEGLGEYTLAINEYVKASKYEPRAGLRKRIKRQISKLLFLCRGKASERKVTWQDIEQMLPQPSAPCNPTRSSTTSTVIVNETQPFRD